MLYSSTRAHAHASRFVGFGLKKSGNVSLVVHRPTKTVISSVVYGFANSTPSYQVIATTHFPLPSQIACSYWPASRSHPWPVADESRWQSIVPVNPNATLFELVNATAWRVTSKFAGGSPWADDPLPPPPPPPPPKSRHRRRCQLNHHLPRQHFHHLRLRRHPQLRIRRHPHLRHVRIHFMVFTKI